MIERVCRGEVALRPHRLFKSVQGDQYYEHCFTTQGFDGPFTILYHQNKPHQHIAPGDKFQGWKVFERVSAPLAKRHLLTDQLAEVGDDVVTSRAPLLGNDDIVLSICRPKTECKYYFSNADADDLYYIHQGGGVLRSWFGDLPFGEGDYLLIPKGLPHRFRLESKDQTWLSMETFGPLGVPTQWRNAVGQLRMAAPYSHRDFRIPVFVGPNDEMIRQTVVKKGGSFFRFETPHSILDVVGWDGAVYPIAFNILRFNPKVAAYHLPPDWHGTFAARGALICSFVPRNLDFGDHAVTCPYPHTSVDCDEFIFYCSGQFASRRGMGPASISYHPRGLTHGPHPGAYENSVGVKDSNELAVMIDTERLLELSAAALSIDDPVYHQSFL